MPRGQPITRGRRADLVTRVELPQAPTSSSAGNRASPVVMKAVLFVLDQFSGQNRTCWPSTELIARCACCSCRAVQRAIDALARLELVHLQEREGRSRRWISNREFSIDYQQLEDLVGDSPSEPSEEERAPVNTSPPGGDPPSPVGVTLRRPGGDRASPPKCGLGEKERATNKHEPSNAVKPDMAGGPNGEPDWVDSVRSALLRIGVDPARIRPLCLQAGTPDRIQALLVMLDARQGRLEEPARYFAHLCAHPEINPNAAEQRKLHAVRRREQTARQSSLEFIPRS